MQFWSHPWAPSVGHPLFKEATGVINLLYRTMTMAMNRNTHLCNFKSDTTIILTRNVTWNSSAPNATPITSYPLTRAMAGGAPCWPAQHCHLRAKALLNWLQPYSLVAWNREACLMSLLKFNRFIKTWIYSQGDLRCCCCRQKWSKWLSWSLRTSCTKLI